MSRQSHQGGGDGCRMWHAWRRREIHKGLGGNMTENGHLQYKYINEKIELQ